MGGIGSGNRFRRQTKKTTVEESLTMDMKYFRRHLVVGSSGSVTWPGPEGRKPSMGYAVSGGDDRRIATLHYRWRDKENISIPVRLTPTPTQFGGPRWWFVCPLIVGGITCNRRVSKLYLPPGAKYFGCRKCHELTYRSSQLAHQDERLVASMERIVKWLDRREDPVISFVSAGSVPV